MNGGGKTVSAASLSLYVTCALWRTSSNSKRLTLAKAITCL